MKKYSIHLLVILFLIFLFPNCIKRNTMKVKSVKQAFGVETDEKLGVFGTKIIIKKDALEGEFLLQAETIDQSEIPTYQGMQSKIVYFVKRDGKVYMHESSIGNVASDTFKQHLLIAEFPILLEDTNSVTIDFNKGMTELLQEKEFYGSDGGETDYNSDRITLKVDKSYIDRAYFSKKNQIVIEQVVKFNIPLIVPNSLTSMLTVNKVGFAEMKYYFSPYKANPNFKPFEVLNHRAVKFFEVTPTFKNTGDELTTVTNAVKFDTEKEIVFAISSNTPKEYREAAKAGVLYWNRTLGKDLIKVIDAPEGVRAPDPDYNLIQWVSWPNAGYAYADAQMDPRTGEILHAQVFIPDAFAIGNIKAVKKYIDILNLKANATISLSGFNTTTHGDPLAEKETLKELLATVADTNDESKLLKISQDSMAETIAHEVGHCLGLRHNFAGSMSMNYKLAERDALFRKYFSDGSLPSDLIPSSSLMDYQAFYESAFTGAIIMEGKRALPYDEKAMKNLYFGAEVFEENPQPLFCNDSDRDKFVGCHAFDIGNSIADASSYGLPRGMLVLPYNLAATYLELKEKSHGDSVPLKEEILKYDDYLTTMLGDSGKLIKALSTGTKLFAVYNYFGTLNELNKKKYEKYQLDFINDDINKHGGMAEVLKPIPQDFYDQEYVAFKKFLEKEKDKFTSQELTMIEENASEMLKKLNKKLVDKQLELLALKDTKGEDFLLKPSALSNEYAKYLLNTIVKYYLFDEIKNEDIMYEVKGEIENLIHQQTLALTPEAALYARKSIAFLPKYRYSLEQRKAAINLLSSSLAKLPIWGKDERKALQDQFAEDSKKIFENLSEKELGDLLDQKTTTTTPLKKWVADYKEIRDAISNLK